jgi:hypothetical protein
VLSHFRTPFMYTSRYILFLFTLIFTLMVPPVASLQIAYKKG